LSEEDQADLADVAVGTTGSEAAGFLLHYVRSATLPRETLVRYLKTIVRSVPQDQADELARFVSEKFGNDPELQLDSLKSVLEGLSQRGATPGQAVRKWGEDLAKAIFAEAADKSQAWTFHSLPGSTDSRNPWGEQARKSADKDKSEVFLSSNVNGETLTGVARSADFVIPEKLTFFLAGHNGTPSRKHPIKNIVRLRDAKTDEVLAEQAPPRSDVAQKVTWDLTSFAGRQGYFEATDGDSGTAYAWLAFGRFEPPVIKISSINLQLTAAAQIVQSLGLNSLGHSVEGLLGDRAVDAEARVAAAKALATLDAPTHAVALAAVVRDRGAPDPVRVAAADALGPVSTPESSSALIEAITTAPERMQLAFAKALAATRGGAQVLLDSIQSGKASAHLLQDANLVERLNISKPANLDERIASLTKGLPTADAAIQKLIDTRAAEFNPSKASPKRGRVVFEKTCMVCHMVGGKGAHVGPQLDGIGVRGVPRLCEDILDPSRNVDVAFRYSTFVLSDGNVIAGIPRKEEGQVLTVADSTGKEVQIDKSKITRRVESKLSLMPSNFGEIIPPKDFNDLMSYLLSTAKP
jgi:putative heme-binding domain-containing protein